MADLTLLDGATFFYSEDSGGDVDASRHEGFFHEDVRHLSLWALLVDGKPLDVLTGTTGPLAASLGDSIRLGVDVHAALADEAAERDPLGGG